MYFQASLCDLPVREMEEVRARSSKAVEAMLSSDGLTAAASVRQGQGDTNKKVETEQRQNGLM